MAIAYTKNLMDSNARGIHQECLADDRTSPWYVSSRLSEQSHRQK